MWKKNVQNFILNCIFLKYSFLLYIKNFYYYSSGIISIPHVDKSIHKLRITYQTFLHVDMWKTNKVFFFLVFIILLKYGIIKCIS